MSMRHFTATLLVVTACQSGSGATTKPPPPKGTEPGSAAGSDWKTSAYGRDFERLCNAEKYSGALEEPEEARPLMVAQWLGPNLETSQAHDFLVHIQPLGPMDKYVAIDGEAHRLGLTDCPLALVWKKAASSPPPPPSGR
jgi:hypothetical protein